jgi:hypothetical protein
MSDYKEIMAVMNNGPISVALKIPMNDVGAVPFFLSDIAKECKDMFESAMKSVSDWDMVLDETTDDEGTITTDEA